MTITERDRLKALNTELLAALEKCRAYIAREDDADDMAECLDAAIADLRAEMEAREG